MQASRVARLAGSLGVAAVALFLAGPLFIQLGLIEPFTGFQIFLLGGLLGLLALASGVLGLFFTRPAAYREGRRRALVGTVLGALVTAAILMGARGGRGVPAINDITTNPDDPPAFASDPWKHGRDMRYPAGFTEQQRAGYPDLAPIVVPLPPAAALERVASLFASNGWVVTQKDPVSNTLTGTGTSRLFKFVDDIVVRVRPQDGGSVVDMRSKSRVGKGDMGANAARIRKLTAELKGAAS
ncbi:MAG TPA: DUF1499 domain-containing protein [Myxococcota bacterium]|nr:DUF1499 domain-containing protein [Myxococcota bacterium]